MKSIALKFLNTIPDEDYDGSIVDLTTGQTQAVIKHNRKAAIAPYYIRFYSMNSDLNQILQNLPNMATYKIFIFICWCLNKTLIARTNRILASYQQYLDYCTEISCKAISRASYYKAIKVLMNVNILKKSNPKGIYEINFKYLANGKYQQGVF